MKVTFKDVLVFILMAAGILVICLFLPERVPIHVNFRGEADLIVNKYFLLLGTVIPYSLYWIYFRGGKDKK